MNKNNVPGADGLVNCTKCGHFIPYAGLKDSPYCPNCHELQGDTEPTIWEDHLISSRGDIGPLMRAVKKMENLRIKEEKIERMGCWIMLGIAACAAIFIFLGSWFFA